MQENEKKEWKKMNVGEITYQMKEHEKRMKENESRRNNKENQTKWI